jgi:PAS domain S-box-containing protein
MALAAGQQGLFDLDVPSGDVVVSAGFATMLGHDPETFRLTYESWLASLHPDDVERVQRIVAEYLAGALGEVYHAVFRMRTASGDYRWISSTGRLLTRDDQGRPLRMLGTHTDITSHKAAQLDAQRLAHLYAALSASSEAVGRHAQVEPLLQAVCDAAVHAGGFDMAWAGLYEAETGDIRRVAQAGPALDYLNGLHLSTRPDDPTSIGPAAQSILTNAPAGFDDVAAAAFDAHWRTRALSHGWRSILGFPLRRGGRPVGSLVLYARAPDAFDEASRRLLGQMAENVSFALDALERDRRRLAAEGEVRRSLNEREALLKEIHHRVKNNLQVITSLLRLEANRADTPEVRGVLVEMKNRVLSMALLHELLYRSDTLASVNLATYLSELGRQVFEVSALHAGIRLETALAPVQVDLDQAVPCGLLVNELLANALKHGFPDGRRGTVALTVSCDESTGTISLTVADDGVGLAPDFETRRQRSLGLQMVADLTRQLDGRLQIDAPSGARFRVTFQRRGTPATPPRPSRPPEALPVPEAFPSRRRDPANQ